MAGLSEEALLAGLRECADHHVLVPDSRAGTYTFRHSLLREAAYAGLLPGEAARLHAAYGRALQAAPAPAPAGGAEPTVADLAAVAWHLYAAGDAEQALPATLAAAVAAETAGGYSEGPRPVRAGPGAGRPAPGGRRCGRRVRASTARRWPNGRPKRPSSPGRRPGRWSSWTSPSPEPARRTPPGCCSPSGGRDGRPGTARVPSRAYDEAVRQLVDRETGEGVRAVAAAAEARMLAGRYGESRRLAEDGLALARRLQLPREEAEILGTLGVDLALLGDADAAVTALAEAVEAAEKDGRPRPLARAWINRAEVLAGPLNRLGEAAGVAAAGLDRLRGLGLGRSYGAVLAATLANTLFRSGRWDDADPVVEAALAERPTGAAAIELLLARCRLAVGRGDFAAAHADLERLDHRSTQAVAPRYQAPLLTLAAGLALWEGRIGDAREAVVRALDLVAGSDDGWLVAPVLWHGLRAEGDQAEHDRAVGRRVEAETAADAAAGLLERARVLQQGAAAAVRPVVAAYVSLCGAEERRAAGDGDPDAWADAAERWAGLDQPYPCGLCPLPRG